MRNHAKSDNSCYSCEICLRIFHKNCLSRQLLPAVNPSSKQNYALCLHCKSRSTTNETSELNNRNSLTSQTPVVNPCYTDFFDNCNYYDQQSLNNFLSAQTETLFIMHFNIRSLQKNSDHLASYLSELSVLPDIIAITETKLTNGIINSNIHLTGYAFFALR